MAKSIKTFTVDKNVYDSVVKLFKDSESAVSVSLFINNCLEELLAILQEVDSKLKNTKEYTVPLSFIIKTIIESNNILGIGQDVPEEMRMGILLHFWQVEYEAKKKRIPYELYKYITGESVYMLSPDKTYLIDKITGDWYVPVGKDSLACIRKGKSRVKGRRK